MHGAFAFTILIGSLEREMCRLVIENKKWEVVRSDQLRDTSTRCPRDAFYTSSLADYAEALMCSWLFSMLKGDSHDASEASPQPHAWMARYGDSIGGGSIHDAAQRDHGSGHYHSRG